jgi:RNA polymerase sigma factor (sigma-70 family)
VTTDNYKGGKSMNYCYIESLVQQAKGGDASAKEALALEFSPLIKSLSRKTFINSYEASDIKNECYRTLFKCVNLYNADSHRFVAYATNAIKNSVNHLIRVSVRRGGAEGPGALVLDGSLMHTLCENGESLEELAVIKSDRTKLKASMLILSIEEQELITYVYFKENSLKSYAELKGIGYSTAACKKTSILKKLKKALNMPCRNSYLN